MKNEELSKIEEELLSSIRATADNAEIPATIKSSILQKINSHTGVKTELKEIPGGKLIKSVWRKLKNLPVMKELAEATRPVNISIYSGLQSFYNTHPLAYKSFVVLTLFMFVFVTIAPVVLFLLPGNEWHNDIQSNKTVYLNLSRPEELSEKEVAVLDAVPVQTDQEELDIEELKRAVTITPETEFNLEFDSTTQRIKIIPARRWEFTQKYEVVIKSGVYGSLVIKEDYSFSFTTSAKVFSTNNSLIWIDSLYNKAHEFIYEVADPETNKLKFKLYNTDWNSLSKALNMIVKSEERKFEDMSKQKALNSWEMDVKPAENATIAVPVTEVGMYMLETYDNENELITQNYIIINSFGVSAQKDNSKIITFAQSLDKSELITNLELEFIDLDPSKGLTSAGKSTTNKELSEFNQKSYLDAEVMIIKYNGELAVVNLVHDMYENLYIDSYINDSKSNYYLYFDKPVYKPTDLVNFKAIIREREDGLYTLPKPGTEYKIGFSQYLINNGEYEFKTLSIPVNSFGSLIGSINLPEYLSNTKEQYVNVSINGKYAGSINIKDYIKPAYDTDSSMDKTSYVKNDNVKVTFTGKTYAGNPITDGKITYNASISTAVVTCGEYSGYGGESINLSQGELGVNQDGQSNLDIKLDQSKANYPGSILIGAEYYSGLGESTPIVNSAQYYPADFVVLAKTKTYSFLTSKNTQLEFALFDKDCNQLKLNKELTVEGVLTNYKQIKVNDSRRYIYEREDHQLEKLSLKADADGVYHFDKKLDKTGSYSLTVSTNDDSNRSSRVDISFYVSEVQSYWYEDINNSDLLISTDKKIYNPADEINLKIDTKGIRGKALLNISGTEIIDYKFVDFDKDEIAINLPYSEKYLPNIFISLSIFAQDTFISSQIPVKYDMTSKNLGIEINTDKAEYAPRAKVELNIDVKDKSSGKPVQADLSISVVDKALLDYQGFFANESGDGAFSSFWAERFATIENYNSLEFTMFFSGGGRGDGGDSSPRKDFKDTAFWKGDVITSQSGTANVSFNLPDNVGTWVVLVTGSTQNNQFGHSNHQFSVNLPLVLETRFPKELIQGDKPSAYAYITNNTNSEINATAEIETGRLSLNDNKNKQIAIPAGKTKSVKWNLSAGDVTERSNIIVRVKAGNLNDAIETNYSVVPAKYLNRESILKQGSWEQSITVEDTYKANITVNLYPSLASYIPGSVVIPLTSCCESAAASSEKLMSAVFLLDNYSLFGKNSGYTENQLKKIIRVTQQSLYSSQKYTGGWSWWPEGSNDDSLPEITSVVLVALKRSNKYQAVPSVVTKSALAYLKSSLNKSQSPQVNAIGQYALSFYEKPARSSLSKYTSDTSLDAYVYSYLALASANAGYKDLSDSYISALLAKSKLESNLRLWQAPANNDNSLFGALKQNTQAIAVYTLAAIKPTSSETTQSAEAMVKIRDWYGVFGNYYAASGLHLLTSAKGTGNISGSYTIKHNGNIVSSGQLTTGPIKVVINKNIGASNLLSIDAGANSNSEVHVDSYVSQKPELPYTITRQFFDLSGNEISSAKLGQPIIVRIEMYNLPSQYSYIVKDVIPAGFIADDNYLYLSWAGNIYGQTAEVNGNDIEVWKYNRDTNVVYYKMYATTPGEYSFGSALVTSDYIKDLAANSSLQRIIISE